MTDYEVIIAPFPYVDAPQAKWRPCVLIGAPENDADLVWVIMITSANRTTWPDDIPLTGSDLSTAGLQSDCVIRTSKVATLERRETKSIGRLTGATSEKLRASLRTLLSL